MLKKVFLAAALSLAMVGAAMTTVPTEALAGKTGCYKKAKAKYGLHLLKRHSYKKACKAKHK
jgi:peptidoglycan hydrolase CwlO-like protein